MSSILPEDAPPPLARKIPAAASARKAWVSQFVSRLLYASRLSETPVTVATRLRRREILKMRDSPESANVQVAAKGILRGVQDPPPNRGLDPEAYIYIMLQREGKSSTDRYGIPVHLATLERPARLRGGFADHRREFRFPELSTALFPVARKPKTPKVP